MKACFHFSLVANYSALALKNTKSRKEKTMKKFKVLFVVSVIVFSYALIVLYLGIYKIEIIRRIGDFGCFMAGICFMAGLLGIMFSLSGLSRSRIKEQENILHGKPINP
ncbi:MAG: hypothetical protein LiPW39_516 [Parcubacteria group bacterium LiPW_39]|nr:MAG: hypothetical protein LiPW39_516 [Parcubacteria group bacterium LiPW_39]